MTLVLNSKSNRKKIKSSNRYTVLKKHVYMHFADQRLRGNRNIFNSWMPSFTKLSPYETYLVVGLISLKLTARTPA